MTKRDRWLLPDGVEDVLPSAASAMEWSRRTLLDRFSVWGYEYVIPPMIEFLDSLLTGTGRDLDIKTLKVTDQLSGRTLGIRADITPQVARIDAHGLNREGVVRLCYAGTILHSRPQHMLASRTPSVVGAELFGDTGHDGDLEIVSLMLESLAAVGMADVHLELGDVSIFRSLTGALDDDQRDDIFALIQSKAHAELAALLATLPLDASLAGMLEALPRLCGGPAILDEAAELFNSDATILRRIEQLREIAAALTLRFPGIDLYYDLSELRGYDYHTGIVFAAYAPSGSRVAKGGRYDDVGEVFGRRRGATGFDIHVNSLLADIAGPGLNSRRIGVSRADILDPECWQRVTALRENGDVVIECGPDVKTDGRLAKEHGSWQVREQSNSEKV